jgi:hypothetical protein
MSLLFFTIVLAALMTDPSLLSEGLFYEWALFSISDALWINVLRRK